MRMRALTLLMLLGTLAPAREVTAQASTLCPPIGAANDSGGAPVVVIRARAQAEQIRFESRPEVRVRLTGCSLLDSVRVLERTNLPDPIQPGVTYRNVTVAVEILGHLNLQCLLAATNMGRDSSAGAAGETPPAGRGRLRVCAGEAAETPQR
jgi:hypothetical protein